MTFSYFNVGLLRTRLQLPGTIRPPWYKYLSRTRMINDTYAYIHAWIFEEVGSTSNSSTYLYACSPGTGVHCSLRVYIYEFMSGIDVERTTVIHNPI